MKTLTFPGSWRPDLLTDELLAAFPAWRGTLITDPMLGQVYVNPLLQLSVTRDQLTLTLPDDADESALAAVLAAHNPAARTRAELHRAQVLDLAAGAAGKRLVDLTAAEVRALLAVLLWRNGAIDEALRVRPLDDWT